MNYNAKISDVCLSIPNELRILKTINSDFKIPCNFKSIFEYVVFFT